MRKARESYRPPFKTALQESRISLSKAPGLDDMLGEMRASAERIKAISKAIRSDPDYIEAVRGKEKAYAISEPVGKIDKFTRILNHYQGLERIITCEELSELAVELAEDVRGHGDRDRIADEIADVWICAWMMLLYYDVSANELVDRTDEKLERQLERIRKEQENGQGSKEQS